MFLPLRVPRRPLREFEAHAAVGFQTISRVLFSIARKVGVLAPQIEINIAVFRATRRRHMDFSLQLHRLRSVRIDDQNPRIIATRRTPSSERLKDLARRIQRIYNPDVALEGCCMVLMPP